MKSGQFSLSQRRRQLRFSCHVPVLCTHGTTTEPATVVDLGEGGVRIVLAGRLKTGSVVKLHYNSEPRGAVPHPPVSARVAWTGRNRSYCEAGLAWQDIQIFWVPALLRCLSPSEATSDVRRTRRFATSFHACLRTESAMVDGELTDMSLGGAAFSGTTELSVGDRVVMSIEPHRGRPLMLDGCIVRQGTQDGTRVGIAFDPLADETRIEVFSILRRLRSTPRPSPLVDKRLVTA